MLQLGALLYNTLVSTHKKTNKQCFLIELLKMRINFFKVFYNINMQKYVVYCSHIY